MQYQVIQPPFTLKFRDMPKPELREYAGWFHAVAPHRIEQLGIVVRQTSGFEDWKPDFSPASLDGLGAWFSAHVETRPRTMDEILGIRAEAGHPIDIAGEELTDRTFSLAMDVGMYLSQVFLANHPTLRWDQIFGSRKFVDFGQPVLVGFGNAPLNPVHIVVTLAYGMASGKKDGRGLRRIYEVWSKLVS